MIVTSRFIIPVSICDISVTIGKRNIPARVLYLGLVVVVTVDSNVIPPFFPIPSISNKEYKVGDAVEVYGLNGNQLVQKRTQISAISAIYAQQQAAPAFRVSNIEAYALLDSPYTQGGVLIDPTDSSIVAFWISLGSCYAGLNYQYYIHSIVESLKTHGEVQSWCCGWSCGQINLARAMDFGVPEHHATRIDNIAKTIGTGAQVVWVIEKLRRSCSGLEVGDLILEINDESVGRMADVRCLSQAEIARILVLRDRREKEVILHSKRLPSQGTSRVVCWAGAILQQTPSFALEQITPEFTRVLEREGIDDPETLVYISSYFGGSPASGTLSPVHWILEIEEQKVRSMEMLLDITATLKGRCESDNYIRVKLVGRYGITSIVGVKLNSHFWPAWILELKGKKWVRTELE
jgi:hypothetical protein